MKYLPSLQSVYSHSEHFPGRARIRFISGLCTNFRFTIAEESPRSLLPPKSRSGLPSTVACILRTAGSKATRLARWFSLSFFTATKEAKKTSAAAERGATDRRGEISAETRGQRNSERRAGRRRMVEGGKERPLSVASEDVGSSFRALSVMKIGRGRRCQWMGRKAGW